MIVKFESLLIRRIKDMMQEVFSALYDCANGIEPKKGTGSATFVRSSTAHYAAVCSGDLGGDPVGTIKTAAIDAHRIESNGVLIEAETTNLIPNNIFDIFGGSNFTKSLDNTTSPRGIDGEVCKVEANPSVTFAYVDYGKSGSWDAGDKVTSSMYVKKGNNTHTTIRTFHSGGTNNTAIILNMDTEEYTTFADNASLASFQVDSLNNGWFRLSVTLEAGSNTTSFNVRAYPHDWTDLGPDVGGLYVFLVMPQMEDLMFPSSWIETTGTEETRTADQLNYPTTGNFDPALFSIEATFDVLGIHETNNQTILAIGNSGMTEYVSLVVDTAGNLIAELASGNTDTMIATTTLVPNTQYKVNIVYDGTLFKLVVDDVVDRVRTASASQITTPDKIHVGSFDGTLNMYGHVKPLKIYDIDTNVVAYTYTPEELFFAGEQGVVYIPSDLSTLFQDSTGATPVTADGDPIGLMLDKSQGLELGEELVTGTTILVQSGWVDNGDGSFTATSTNNYFTVTCPMVQGTLYQYSYTVEEYTSGTLRIGLDSDYTTYRTPFQGEVFTAYFTAGNPNADDYLIWGGSSFTGKVSGLSVKEVKGNHATQSISAARPTYKTNGTLHWLEFDGIDDCMDVGSAFNHESITAVVGVNGEDYGRILDNRGTGGPGAVAGWQLKSNNGIANDWVVTDDADSTNATIVSGGVATNTDGIIYMQYDDTTDTLSAAVDGAAFSTDTEASGGSILTNVGGKIGASSNAADQLFEGRMYSIVVINNIRNASERGDLEAYVAEKSGVSL